MTLVSPVRMLPQHILDIAINQIVDIADRARTDPNVIKLWVGEPDLRTPSFITDATIQALQAGETRYTYSLGLPTLREALARYHQRHWQVAINPARFSATIGGMNAIMPIFQALLEPGDKVWRGSLITSRNIIRQALPPLSSTAVWLPWIRATSSSKCRLNAAAARQIFYDGLNQLPNVTAYKPQGTFYMWLAVAGVTHGYDVAVSVLKETRVGIAPGSGFGPGGERFLRICFVVDTATAEEAIRRLTPFLDTADFHLVVRHKR